MACPTSTELLLGTPEAAKATGTDRGVSASPGSLTTSFSSQPPVPAAHPCSTDLSLLTSFAKDGYLVTFDLQGLDWAAKRVR
jgi:hypothetical protein